MKDDPKIKERNKMNEHMDFWIRIIKSGENTKQTK